MDMQVEHLLQRQFGEIRFRVDEQIGSSLHGAFAKVKPLGIFNRIGPAKIVMPSVSPDIPEYSSAVPFPSFPCAPNVIDQFVIVESEVRRDVAVPPC